MRRADYVVQAAVEAEVIPMSIRSVDMQHTIQQAAAAERVQAVDRGQADQQGQQFEQQLQRTQQVRHTTVVQSEDSPEARHVDADEEGETGKRRRRPRRDRRPRSAEPGSGPAPDGQVHLIDIRA